MVLSKYLTTKDVEVWVAGRKLAVGKSLSLEITSNVQDVALLNSSVKKHYRTTIGVSGSMELLHTDLQAFGLVLGDFELDPSGNTAIDMSTFRAADFIRYIQGDTTGTDEEIDGTTETRIGQKFYAPGSALSILKINVAAGGDSTSIVTIETDTTGSPSGTPVTNGTSNSVDFTTGGWTTVTFANDPVLTKGEPYWIVVTVDASTTFEVSATDLYPDWLYKIYTGTWGSAIDNDTSFDLTFEDTESYGRIILDDSVVIQTWKLDDVAFERLTLSGNPDDILAGELTFTSKNILITEV